MNIRSVEYCDKDSIMIYGAIMDSKSGLQCNFISTLDTFGNIGRVIRICDPLGEAHLTYGKEAGIHYDNSVMALPFGMVGRSSLGVALIYNSQVSVINEFDVDTALVVIPKDIAKSSDGYLITGIIQGENFDTDAFVLKTTLHGELVWMRRYGRMGFIENPRGIISVNERFLIYGSRIKEEEPYSGHGWAIAIDSIGDVTWEWDADTLETPSGGILAMCFERTANEYIYFTDIKRTTTFPGEDYEVSAPVFVHRDSAMNLIAYKILGPYAYNHYIGTLEKSYLTGWIAAGNITSTTDDYLSPVPSQSGRIVRLSADGVIEWSVQDTAFFHAELGSRGGLSGLTELASGSVIAVGHANNYNTEDEYRSYGWLLKIRRDGCVDTLCTTSDLLHEVSDYSIDVQVYPNPATNYIVVNVNSRSRRGKRNLYFSIITSNGQVVTKSSLDLGLNLVDISQIAISSGIYVWSVKDDYLMCHGTGKLFVSGNE